MFGREIMPQAPQVDSRGDPLASDKPTPLFAERAIEGDIVTGDTRDGGDDARLRAREQEIADGWVSERNDGERPARSRRASQEDGGEGGERRLSRQAAERNDAAADDGYSGAEDEPGERELTAEGADAADAEVDDEQGAQKFEVTVDGKPHEVTLAEALRGYVRQSTFHQRMAHLNQRQQEQDAAASQLQQNWAAWNKARADYEEDLANLIPAEPNWDQEFAANPQHAHAQQKIFQTLYAKLAQSRQMRAQREAADAAETDRRVQKYAVDGFSKFVMDHIKSIPDEPTLKKNIQSMRRTAMAAGFSEQEVATVYDPRMLDVLWKASKYDRMIAGQPKPVIAGMGRTLTPGAATPLGGNGRRKSFDDAQRQLARSGSLEDAADVFRRML